MASPPYTAVTECEPAVNAEVVSVAWPEPFRVPVPRVVAPSLNVTVPVGVEADPVTVAVKVTDWPKTDGFSEEPTAVELKPFTVCVSGAEVLPV